MNAGLNIVFSALDGMCKKALRQQPHNTFVVSVVNHFHCNSHLSSDMSPPADSKVHPTWLKYKDGKKHKRWESKD
jgi:hypothetical protein